MRQGLPVVKFLKVTIFSIIVVCVLTVYAFAYTSTTDGPSSVYNFEWASSSVASLFTGSTLPPAIYEGRRYTLDVEGTRSSDWNGGAFSWDTSYGGEPTDEYLNYTYEIYSSNAIPVRLYASGDNTSNNYGETKYCILGVYSDTADEDVTVINSKVVFDVTFTTILGRNVFNDYVQYFKLNLLNDTSSVLSLEPTIIEENTVAIDSIFSSTFAAAEYTVRFVLDSSNETFSFDTINVQYPCYMAGGFVMPYYGTYHLSITTPTMTVTDYETYQAIQVQIAGNNNLIQQLSVINTVDQARLNAYSSTNQNFQNNISQLEQVESLLPNLDSPSTRPSYNIPTEAPAADTLHDFWNVFFDGDSNFSKFVRVAVTTIFAMAGISLLIYGTGGIVSSVAGTRASERRASRRNKGG